MSTNGRSISASSGAAILLIDDNLAVTRVMEIAFGLAGHRLDAAVGPEQALSWLARGRYDAILLDMNFSVGAANGEEGMALLRRIIADDPAACVIVITAHSGIRIAVAAMQAGARDFVMKPWRNAELIAKVEAAIARGAAPAMVPVTPARADAALPVLLGESPAMHRLRDLVRRIGPTSASVAVIGRPGTGRTLTARAILAAARDPDDQPTRIDLRDDAGWSRIAAASGSLILRHVDLLDPIAQDRLLDLLPHAVRCITVVATVEAMIPALRRRLAVAEVAVPPLAERGDDAVLLARHFALAAAERFGRRPLQLTQAAEAAVRATIWRDEVRGLALAIERAALLAEEGVIDAAAIAQPSLARPGLASLPDSGFDLSDAERAMVEAALRQHRHNVTQAAAALGLSRGALYRRMARYGL
ncbi:MAG: response regulator [Pseudomonadota bacterium]|nr:response regulator [Pseudomonadota bacterium]